ncbi:MAG: reverse transcriptase-like protein [Candidatus Levybacteria bacterium]|nr:reverse transcriptase-like protein [Candidatus Levybacteria bacterium]
MKICKTCGSPLVVKQTKRTPEQLKKQYYYTAYYYCPRCHRLYHDDEFKVVNKNADLFSSKPHKPVGAVDVEIWTDGACVYNGTDRASAAWAFVSGKVEKSGRVEGKQTNNTAEAYAVYHALLWALEEGYKKILIHSDSQITIGNLRKPYEMVKENQEIFRLIHDVIMANNLEVWYRKVLGHSGDHNNERVDRLANTLAAS